MMKYDKLIKAIFYIDGDRYPALFKDCTEMLQFHEDCSKDYETTITDFKYCDLIEVINDTDLERPYRIEMATLMVFGERLLDVTVKVDILEEMLKSKDIIVK